MFVDMVDATTSLDEESGRALNAVVPSILADTRPRCLALNIPTKDSIEIIAMLISPLETSPSVTLLIISVLADILLDIGLENVLVSAPTYLSAFT